MPVPIKKGVNQAKDVKQDGYLAQYRCNVCARAEAEYFACLNSNPIQITRYTFWCNKLLECSVIIASRATTTIRQSCTICPAIGACVLGALQRRQLGIEPFVNCPRISDELQSFLGARFQQPLQLRRTSNFQHFIVIRHLVRAPLHDFYHSIITNLRQAIAMNQNNSSSSSPVWGGGADCDLENIAPRLGFLGSSHFLAIKDARSPVHQSTLSASGQKQSFVAGPARTAAGAADTCFARVVVGP